MTEVRDRLTPARNDTADLHALVPAVSENQPRERPRVVIVGAGFGCLATARASATAPIDVIIAAGLSPADIASPIRGILRRQRNATVLLGAATGIDKEKRALRVGEKRIGYDYLCSRRARGMPISAMTMGSGGPRAQDDRRRHRNPPPDPHGV